MWYMYSTLEERKLVFVSMIAVSLGMNRVSSSITKEHGKHFVKHTPQRR